VLKRTIEELAHPEVRYKIIRAGIGGVSEDDALLASASKAVIIGFGVTADAKARREIERTKVELKTYDIIYELTEDLEKALEGELAPETQEHVKGHAVIRAIFKSSKLGNIAGCYVTDGTIHRDNRVRLVRDGRIVYDGRLDSLRRFQDDVREVKENYECGIHLHKYDDLKVDDVVEAYETVEVARTLDSPTPAKAE
jgi:translation initiation factor IF-2